MLRISVDDGCISDLRVADICREYGIPLTLYLPVEWQRLAHSAKNRFEPLAFYDVRELLRIGVKLGSHGITHRLLTRIPKLQAEEEINDSQYILAGMFDVEVDSFAPARGYTNSELTRFTLERYEYQRLTVGDNLVHIHPDSGANGKAPWQAVANSKLGDGIKDLELWGHSWEITKFNLWDELIDFLDDHKFIKKKKYEDLSS